MVGSRGLWLVFGAVVLGVTALNGPNVCMVKQKYNITKRVKYRAPMSIRTYEWCLSIPPRCSKWSTEIRDLTRLETEERTAEVAVCCPGYKMRDVSCVPICPNGRTGSGCTQDCPSNKWGPNCVNECGPCVQGSCSPISGECLCQDEWQGESCETRMPPSTTPMTTVQEILTTTTKISPTAKNTTPVIVTSTETSTAITSSSTPTSLIKTSTTSVTVTERVTKQIPREEIQQSPSTTIYRNITTQLDTTVLTPTQKSVPNFSTTINPITIKSIQNNTQDTSSAMYNRTDLPPVKSHINIKPILTTSQPQLYKELTTTTEKPKSTTVFRIQTTKTEAPRLDNTIRTSTTKFKPKEIWIRPAQKGETIIETKLKASEPQTRQRSVTNKDVPANTTPKTIIVSIIPTSVSYATFKKIALTSALHVSTGANTTDKLRIKTTEQDITKPMTVETSTVRYTKMNAVIHKDTTVAVNTTTLSPITTTTKEPTNTNSGTNSMNALTIPTVNQKSSTNSITITNEKVQRNITFLLTGTTKSLKDLKTSTIEVPRHLKTTERNALTAPPDLTSQRPVNTNFNKNNATKTLTNVVTTERAQDEETFHILTEPEHITAVMGDRGADRSSVDLVSVISIAGGIMMAVITVAVVIVMVERCKRPQYEDVRKINDIHMQVMIDNAEVPPPYVRSIFHTPLPDPPNSSKCHYQSISTLDRNLKQFLRPVAVQNISPIMLENFRDILECHYDHLPRRSHEFAGIQSRHSITPSIDRRSELNRLRASVTESTIEAMKCEAKLDVIDNTTSEPLYAEIPCWRPPSEHAIEIMNINGEAVTEL